MSENWHNPGLARLMPSLGVAAVAVLTMLGLHLVEAVAGTAIATSVAGTAFLAILAFFHFEGWRD